VTLEQVYLEAALAFQHALVTLIEWVGWTALALYALWVIWVIWWRRKAD
jgi:hypothetical protein